MDQRFFHAFAALLLLVGQGFAVSSNDAVNYVVQENHFLYDGETYTQSNVPVSFNDRDYWVIPITAGSDVVTYFPVDTRLGTLPKTGADNRQIFTVADNLRELQLAKASITPNSGIDWIFSQKYQSIFSEMALQISDEIFQLNTVETALKQDGITVDLGGMKSGLTSMANEASSVSGEIASASQAESEFVSKPSDESFAAMQEGFSSVFASINSLNSKFLEYNSARNRLKQQISIADIDAQGKSQLSAILEIPAGLQSLGNYNINAQLLGEKLDSAFKGTGITMDSLLDEYGKRLLKNDVYNLLYSENERIKKETRLLSLSEAKNYVLSSENRSMWQSQTKANQLEQDYARALKYFGEKNFEQSEKYANAAIDDAVSVYRGGRKSRIQDPAVSQDFLFQAAGALAVLLVLLYLFNNRRKISGFVSKEPEEVRPYE